MTKKNFSYDDPGLPAGETEFENCVFSGCQLSQSDLTGYEFTGCTFRLCDFSMVKLDGVVLNNVLFDQCKLLGCDFSKVSRFMFKVRFLSTILDYTLFHKTNLKKTVFEKCSLREVIFSEADLSESTFSGCDLTDAAFDGCNLAGADLRTAMNYVIDPVKNRVKKGRYSWPGAVGLLRHLDVEIGDDDEAP